MALFRKNALLFLLVFFMALPSFALRAPEEIVKKLDENFLKIKDLRADINLDLNVLVFGCSGMTRYQGYLLFKPPHRFKIVLGENTFLINGNKIEKIGPGGKREDIVLSHTLDFSKGFNLGLITNNFTSQVIKETAEEIVLEAIPKPGSLKNAKKVYLTIDPKNFLLLHTKTIFKNENLSGKADLYYEKLKGIWIPATVIGRAAYEIRPGILVGFTFDLKTKNLKVNEGITDEEMR